MNEQLIKLIDLCLADGVISDKEREVIYRKAKALGIDEDECEIILEGMTQKAHNAPIVTNLTPAKPKRNFPLKEVKSIKPADLNKEKKLLEDVAKLKEEEEQISANYDLVLDDLKVKTKKVNKTKTETEVDFKKYKASYNKYRKKNITEYFNHVDNLISEKYGKAYLICDTKEKEKLSLSDLKSVNKFITKEDNWKKVANNKRESIFGTILLALIGFFIFLLIYASGIEFWISAIVVVIIFFLTVGWANKTEFNEDNLKAVLKSTDKEFDKSFKALEEQKNIINKYENVIKYNLQIPLKK